MTNDVFGRLAKPGLGKTVLAGYWLVLVVATHVPRDFPGVPAHGTDKFVHVAAFAVLAGLAALNLELAGGRVMRRHFYWLWIVLVLYAGVDELTQPAFGRVASWADWLADAAGAALGLVLFALLRGWIPRRRHTE